MKHDYSKRIIENSARRNPGANTAPESGAATKTRRNNLEGKYGLFVAEMRKKSG